MSAWRSPPRHDPSGASRVEGRGWALTPVLPQPIRSAVRGDQPPAGVARCQALRAARRFRGLRTPCTSLRPGHARCRRRGCRPGACLAADPGRDVHGEIPDVGVQQFAFAGVVPARISMPNVSASSQRLGAADGLRRTVERGEVAVAGALDHRAAESLRDVGGDLTKAV